MVSVDPASQYAVQQARATVKDARAHLDEVVERLARHTARQELDAEARDSEAGAARAAAAARLQSVLEEAGVPIASEDVADVARAWLVGVAEAHERRTELVTEREQVVAELAGLDDVGAGDDPGRQLEEAEQELHHAAEELGQARAAVQEARQEVARREAARTTIEEARVQEDEAQARLVVRERARESGEVADLDALRRRLADLDQEVDSTQAAAEKGRAQVHDALTELRRAEEQVRTAAASGAFEGLAHSVGEQLEVFVLARLAVQRSVGRAGSLPLVLDRALDRIPVQDRGPTLDLLARMAAAVQVVVVSDDHDVAAWAEAAGAERALVTTAAAT
jgi:DNA repair exonuclease SbcCD ATPase subunit